MTTPISEVERAIQFALSSSNAQDIIDGVKNAVASELSTLSPGVDVKFTDYYNHTFMPDIRLEWGKGSKATSRPVFLRNMLRSTPTASDLENLEQEAPVVLGLRSTVQDEAFVPLRSKARQTNRVLVTDIGSLGLVSRSTSTRDTKSTQLQREETGPLARIVQSNLLRSGRGLLMSDDAAQLVTATREMEDPNSNGDFSEFEQRAAEVFAPDGVYQILRAGRLLHFGLTGDSLADFLEIASGQLSETDVSIILPYLLERSDASEDGQFWSTIGAMLDLQTLEESPELHKFDMTALVSANLQSWSAKKAQLTFNSEYDLDSSEPTTPVATDQNKQTPDHDRWYEPPTLENENSDVGTDVVAPTWSFVSGRLTGLFGPWKVLLISDSGSKRLPGRDDGLSAQWDELRSPISAFAVDSAFLRGVTRTVSIGAGESGNVTSDITRISETLDESFRVDNVQVRIPGSDHQYSILADFRKMTAAVQIGTVPISDLVFTALSLLGHRNPVPVYLSALSADVNSLLTPRPEREDDDEVSPPQT